MIAAKELSRTLKRALLDDIQNIFLFNDEGSIIAAANSAVDKQADSVVAAVLASIFGEYRAAEQCVTDDPNEPNLLNHVIMDCDQARVAVTVFLRGDDSVMFLCAVGSTKVPHGLLLKRLELVRDNISCLKAVLLAAMEPPDQR